MVDMATKTVKNEQSSTEAKKNQLSRPSKQLNNVTFDQNGPNAISADFEFLAASLPS